MHMKSNTKTIAAVLALIPMSLFSFIFAQGENLVENGSFESTTGKTKKLGGIEAATGWVSPTGVRADLFTPAAKLPEISTPTNVYGSEEPKDGDNYAGIVAYSYNDKMPRSYVSTKLTSPLKKGLTYCIQANVSLAELSKYSCNQLGVHVSKKQFATEEKSSIIDKTHILIKDNKVLNAMYGWDRVCGSFVAEGGEKYITIGNFTNNDKVLTEKNKKPDNIKGTILIASYYYIDDVSVTLVEAGSSCDCGTADVEEVVSNTVYQKSVVLNEKMTSIQKIEVQANYFGFGKNILQPAGMASLDLIATELKANPTYKLEISGYCDENEISKGLEKPIYADMDKKRIASVIQYLKDKGIAETRIIEAPKANSEQNPDISEGDEEDLKMAKNRRVTFKVIK